MISIMTNAGALEFGRSLSGGNRFLAWEAALLSDGFDGATVQEVASLGPDSVNLGAGLIAGKSIAHLFECTGALPVKVSASDNGTTEAMAVDLDFNGQVPMDGNTVSDITYKAVVALGRRYYKYLLLGKGSTYNTGDHVWGGSDHATAYVCLTDGFVYDGIDPAEDPEHWAALDAAALIAYPMESDFFCNPSEDIVPFFVTSYDNPVTMSNGMEWEYKVRVFLDNVATTELSKLSDFSLGGLEANGSLMLTFLAGISEQFRTIREQITTTG